MERLTEWNGGQTRHAYYQRCFKEPCYYFDYEDATPDDAGSDCVANWDYFSRHYTCIEVERATEGAT